MLLEDGVLSFEMSLPDGNTTANKRTEKAAWRPAQQAKSAMQCILGVRTIRTRLERMLTLTCCYKG